MNKKTITLLLAVTIGLLFSLGQITYGYIQKVNRVNEISNQKLQDEKDKMQVVRDNAKKSAIELDKNIKSTILAIKGFNEAVDYKKSKEVHRVSFKVYNFKPFYKEIRERVKQLHIRDKDILLKIEELSSNLIFTKVIDGDMEEFYAGVPSSLGIEYCKQKGIGICNVFKYDESIKYDLSYHGLKLKNSYDISRKYLNQWFKYDKLKIDRFYMWFDKDYQKNNN